MNRETRRRLKSNEVVRQHSNVIQASAQTAIINKRIGDAFDDGIRTGWKCASVMIYKVAMQVNGIGEKRAAELVKLFDLKLSEIEAEANKK